MVIVEGGYIMEYTVSKLAGISGVSGRTLRYYDQINLLKPARINDSGYRVYGPKEVDVLQQILFYRELGIRLEDIKQVITDPNFNQMETLENHYEQLKVRRDRLNKVIATLESTIKNQKGEVTMQDEAKFSGLKEKIIQDNEQKYGAEIRAKYGHKAIDASNERVRSMSETDYNTVQHIEEEVFHLLKEAKQNGNPVSDIAKQLVDKHKQWLMFSWTSYSGSAHAGLAEMYVADERFQKYYDAKVDGGAQFLRDAIVHHVE